jgi:glycosyltransferase involved in cell wall biosynthesis
MPWRILHLVHQYPPHFVGGTELYTQTLARLQVERGHAVSIFCPSPDKAPDQHLIGPVQFQNEAGVHVYRIPIGPRRPVDVFASTFSHRSLNQAFAAVMEQERPDLVHLEHLMGLPTDLVSHVHHASLPLVITLHDYWFFCANAQLLTNDRQQVCAGPRLWINCGRCAVARLNHPRLTWLAPAIAPVFAYRYARLRSVLSAAQQIIVPTRFVRDACQPLGLPGEKVQLVPHGIQLPVNLRRAPLDMDRTSLRIVYVGGLAFQKGVHVLIQAVNQLPPDRVRLDIYGDLSAFPAYASELRQLARHPGINLAGRVSRDEVWNVLNGADVVAVPSLWYEASPLVIHEAFAAGAPLIVSDIGALRELVQDRINGLVVAAGDVDAWREALAGLLADRALLARLREGIGPVRTIQEHAHDIESVYQLARHT